MMHAGPGWGKRDAAALTRFSRLLEVTTDGSTKLESIQQLRAVAALLVIVYHVFPQLQRMGYAGPSPHVLSSGVDIFFVIGGFVMWLTTCSTPLSPMQFGRRRAVRIVPLYWLLTSVVVLVMLVAPSALQSSRFDTEHVIKSFLFLPAVHPIKGLMEPALTLGWTLNYEMFFYALFGLSLPILRRAARLAAVVGALGLWRLWGRDMATSPQRLHSTPRASSSSLRAAC